MNRLIDIIIKKNLSRILPLHNFFLYDFWKMSYSKLGVIAIILINLENIHGGVKIHSISSRMCYNFGKLKQLFH